MFAKIVVVAVFVCQIQAYPWAVNTVNEEGPEVKRLDKPVRRTAGDAASCPFNPNHVPGVGITDEFPYCGAANGLPGKLTCPNNLVPAEGDTAHAWRAPTSTDIRGPCPALNTMANHGFIARDGITNLAELVDAQQNVFGTGYELAFLLAVVGVALDGDPITTKLSIGCDATNRTATLGLGPELGLDGHNKFEGDTSLTRNDFFTSDGNSFEFNETLFGYMMEVCNGNCDTKAMATYRHMRYQQSVAENGQFAYGPAVLLLYAAASFVYELFPTAGGIADPTTMEYFFRHEQLPPNWYSRVAPYTVTEIAVQVLEQYGMYPVPFGGNTGLPNSFIGIGFDGDLIQNNTLKAGVGGLTCFFYQLVTQPIPASLGGGGSLPTEVLKWAAGMLNPLFGADGSLSAFGCPLQFNND